jgi:hypothetical protein
MSPTDALADLLPERIPSSIGLPAAGMSMPTYGTLHRRGQLPAEFYSHIENGRRLLSRQGFLALAAFRVVAGNGVEIGELRPAAFLRWASLWLRGVPVRELWVRYYGRPGDPDSRVSILPNEDLLSEPPEPGALLTIRLDLDGTFRRAVLAYAGLSKAQREVWEGPADE